MITIRKSVTQYERDLIPEQMERALAWMKQRYPDVNFDNVDFIFSGSLTRCRYYRNEDNEKYAKPVCQILTSRDIEIMYWKPSLGMVRERVDNVGREDVTIAGMVEALRIL